MLHGRNSQLLEKRETRPNSLELEFSLESKMIEFSFEESCGLIFVSKNLLGERDRKI